MIRVTIELESAITGEVTKIGQMHIWNRGDSSETARGNYSVAVCKRGLFDVPRGQYPRVSDATRTETVLNYPRLSYNVWRLIVRALKSAFPEEA